MRRILCFLLFLTSVSAPVTSLAEADTPEARARAVEQYFKQVSMRKMMDDMAKEISKQIPPDQRKSFEEVLTKNLRIEVVESAAKQSLAKHLTLEELNVLVEFMKRPEARSAMDKMKYYMADIMPIMQQELIRAIQQSKPSGQ